MRSEDFSRADRLSDLLRSEISLILRDEVKDPRLEGLTIIKVDLSKDIKKAYVFFSTLNSFNDTTDSEPSENDTSNISLITSCSFIDKLFDIVY